MASGLIDGEVPGLLDWWRMTAADDAAACAAKADEYGSVDLEIMGEALLKMIGWQEAPTRVGIEIACAFYALGKAARMLSAYSRHELPSRDTLLDMHAYAMMVRRVREVGQWP